MVRLHWDIALWYTTVNDMYLPSNKKRVYNIYTTLVQHCINVIQLFFVCWDRRISSCKNTGIFSLTYVITMLYSNTSRLVIFNAINENDKLKKDCYVITC